MTTIRITIDQSAAIPRGSNETGSHDVELDVTTLTDAQRAVLASMPTDSGRPKVGYCATSAPADIIARLDKHIAEAAEKQSKIEADNTTLAAWYASAPLADLVVRDSSGHHPISLSQAHWRSSSSHLATTLPDYRRAEVDAEIARLTAIDERVHAEYTAAEALRAADKKTSHGAGIAALTLWAQTHGSERLTQMRTLGIGDWQAVAEEEFFLAHTPAGYSPDQYDRSDATEARKKPTAQELAEYAALLDLVTASGGVLSDARLMRHTMDPHDDEDGEHWDAEHYVATDVDVTAPTGRTLTVAKIIKPIE